MSEACRVIITQEWNGLFNVSAPMQYKPLCYEILCDAKKVLDLTTDIHFTNPGRTLLITMNMSGLVDVAAPMPPKEWCLQALNTARNIIEQFDSVQQPMRSAGYADCLPTPDQGSIL